MRFDINSYWYRPALHFITFLLLPFAWLFGFVTATRRYLYQKGWLKTFRFSIPIIVVGNITVGGTGKTPFVIWLTELLRKQGYKPGIVSRGVGGKKWYQPRLVSCNDSTDDIGDEAKLLAKRSGCPVVISPDRVAAVKVLLEETDCNIVISDDGLQHYRLDRDIEIVIIDGARRFGNSQLLPAGPLREPVKRLQKVDFIVVNGGSEQDQFVMTLEPNAFISLVDNKQRDLLSFKDQTAHAVAGIGNPDRFFSTLKQAGITVIPHPFPDHFAYQSYDVDFKDRLPILMTEKDAVKCTSFADQRYWFLSVTAKIELLEEKLLNALRSRRSKHVSEEDFDQSPCRLSGRGQRR